MLATDQHIIKPVSIGQVADFQGQTSKFLTFSARHGYRLFQCYLYYQALTNNGVNFAFQLELNVILKEAHK